MQHTLLLLLLTTALGAQQTLHVIATINPHPGELARGCEKDRQNVTKLFDYVADALRQRGLDMQVQQHRIGFTPGEVGDFLEGFYVEPDDAVFFLYSGHGLEDTQAPRWPLLYYCEGEEDELVDADGCGLSLHEVHEQIKASGARMSVTVGSSCNAEPTTAQGTVGEVRRLGPREEAMNLENERAEYNFGLFTDYEGHILASSALPGQLAYLNDEVGSYYVDALVNTLVKGLRAEEPVSWASILRRTDRVVREEWRKQQEAQFLISRGDTELYSDTDHHYAGEDEVLQAIPEEDYSTEWEEALVEDEALELLPYLLIGAVAVSSADEEAFYAGLAEARALFDYLLSTADYSAAELDELWSYATEDYSEDEEWFGEERDYALELLDALDEDVLVAIDDFLTTLDR